MVSSRWRPAVDRLCNFLTKSEDALRAMRFGLGVRPHACCIVAHCRGLDTFVSYPSSPQSAFIRCRGDQSRCSRGEWYEVHHEP